ncbi:arginyl-tRNA synthetase [Trichodelitschia bisporula]|uniref:arginine--tRNA ligase n=1 Tax=Trichodelitschia bisporula TaxID=703511 RepID=A0A6G1HQ57_9PEZI|nr:arginyl-tRNA synthetase [Trichodelitschia bisporula]
MDTSALNHTQSLSDLAESLAALGINQIPQAPNTHPTVNPIDVYRSHITDLLVPITGAEPGVIYGALAWTQTLEMGDLALPVPALRLRGRKPGELAEEIASRFPPSPLLEPPVAAGTYVKFWFKPEPLSRLVIPSILKNGAAYGFNRTLGLRDPEDESKGRKKIIVEFSSPNIAKPFHAGHLRSTIIGGFLANLYAGAGWDVVRMNYLGDWGKQYGVLAVGFERFGSEEALVANPIAHLFEVYVKVSAIQKEEDDKMKALREEIAALKEKGEAVEEQEKALAALVNDGIDEQARRYFRRMSDGDPEAIAIWTRFRNLSIEKYRQTYARLNISFDDYSGESQVQDSSMEEAARIMAERGVSEESEGAVIVDLTKYSKKLGKAVVKKKDGTSLYLTRDIGAMKERFDKYNFDKMIYVVAAAQDLHLAQLFKIVELMGFRDISERCQHINFGMVLGMSTRRGTVKFLDDILRDVGEFMHDLMRSNEDKYKQVDDPEGTADILGISAVMVQDMTGKRINNYHFDIKRMTSFEGDTGPYLQYAHARLSSIVRKVGLKPEDLLTADLSLLSEKHATEQEAKHATEQEAKHATKQEAKHAANLVRSLAQFPDVFLNTHRTLEPVTVLTYLFKMTHALSSSYDHLQVMKSDPEVKKARMALYYAARTVLNNGMRLLGLTPLDR